MEVEFNKDFEAKYVELGHDKFINWTTEFFNSKSDSIMRAVHGVIEQDEEPPVDPETETLMREALSKEYLDIVREQATMEQLRRAGIIAPTVEKGMELLKIRNQEEDFFSEQL